ncbi:MAG TPA: acetyl-CoA carboxylase biotin carboxyl carrier protein [Thermoanaerobaculia bacterium]|nr:acetyl-CoA carboxylase biotin carboxyl carrier protein [Thermoanaerobaculia bacterium]
MTFEQIKELVALVSEHRLGGLEIERSGFRLKIEGQPALPAPWPQASLASLASVAAAAGSEGRAAALAPAGGGAPVAAGTLPAGAAALPAPGAREAREAGVERAALPPDAHVLNSPIVGTFYRSPSPDAAPFTEVGARVRKGQVLCIIEAMKLMNEIESDVDGEVAEIYPQNAQAVEFGEPLFAIRIR